MGHAVTYHAIASLMSEKSDVLLTDGDVDVAVVDRHYCERSQGQFFAETRSANRRAKLILHGMSSEWVIVEQLMKSELDSFVSLEATSNEIYYAILDTYAGRRVFVDPRPHHRPAIEEWIAMLTPDDIELLRLCCCRHNQDPSLGKSICELLHSKLRIEAVHEIVPLLLAMNLCADT